MRRRIQSISLALGLALAAVWPAPRVEAIEVRCIEASRYKHIWKLFDDNPKAFAAHLKIDAANLPPPEACRAALLVGRIGPDGEVDKLIDLVLAQKGWLTTLYLNSAGGNVPQGLGLSLVTRMFWLKTRAAFTRPLAYDPDFLLPPLGNWGPQTPEATPDTSANIQLVASGWTKFTQATRGLPPPQEGSGSSSCVSACSMIFSAGIDRQGTVDLHRPRYSNALDGIGTDPNISLSGVMEGLQNAERLQVVLYDQMDSGEAFIRTYRTTATNITMPATTTRIPAYVSDLMLAACKSDAAQLQDLEVQARSAVSYVGGASEGFVDTERLRLALRSVYQRRQAVELCVAQLHEKERLKRYADICKQNCDRASVTALMREQYRRLIAKATPPKPDAPPVTPAKASPPPPNAPPQKAPPPPPKAPAPAAKAK